MSIGATSGDAGVVDLLHQVVSIASRAICDALKPLGVSVAEMAVMRILLEQPDLSADELASRAVISRSTLKSTITDLEERRLLEWRQGPRLTAAGKRLATSCLKRTNSAESKLLAVLDPEEVAALCDLLERL